MCRTRPAAPVVPPPQPRPAHRRRRPASLGYAETNLLDIGDIVEATGKVMRTERGEISVLVENLRLLTKAIRPLPDQWSGLKDREQVLRKRYLDTILEPAVV